MIKAIIVEGADQQGKSTLCKKLQSVLGWDIKHYGPPSKDFDFFNDYLLEAHTISDRNFLSEIVYSTIKGNSHRVDDLDALIEEMDDVLLVYVDRYNDFKFEARNEMYSEAQILQARELYRNLVSSLAMKKYIYENNQESFIELIYFIQNENNKTSKL